MTDTASPRNLVLNIWFTAGDDTDADALVERLFDFLATDPDNLFPEIETVDNWDVGRA